MPACARSPIPRNPSALTALCRDMIDSCGRNRKGRFFTVGFCYHTNLPGRGTFVRKAITETRIEATPETMVALELIVREGARKMLQGSLEAEIEEHLSQFKDLAGEDGKRLVVRNGTMPERTVLTGAGPIPITRPRVDDRALEVLGKE